MLLWFIVRAVWYLREVLFEVLRSDKKSLCEAVPKQTTEVGVQNASGWPRC